MSFEFPLKPATCTSAPQATKKASASPPFYFTRDIGAFSSGGSLPTRWPEAVPLAVLSGSLPPPCLLLWAAAELDAAPALLSASRFAGAFRFFPRLFPFFFLPAVPASLSMSCAIHHDAAGCCLGSCHYHAYRHGRFGSALVMAIANGFPLSATMLGRPYSLRYFGHMVTSDLIDLVWLS